LLRIDWDEFDIFDGEPKDLDQVKVSLTRQAPSRDYGVSKSGTQLIIYGGKKGFELDKKEIKGVNRTILKLNSPYPNPKAKKQVFKVVFECPQVKELDEIAVPKQYDPVFRIYGIVIHQLIFH